MVNEKKPQNVVLWAVIGSVLGVIALSVFARNFYSDFYLKPQAKYELKESGLGPISSVGDEVVGTYRNLTQTNLGNLYAFVSFYSADGSKLSEDVATMTNLAPGESWTFRFKRPAIAETFKLTKFSVY